MIKQFGPSLLFTILITLLVIYLLYPLNKGAIALVFVISGCLVVSIKLLFGKKSRNENKKG